MQWVIFDIFPNFHIIRLIPYHVVVKKLLPNGMTDLFGNDPFELLHYSGDRRGDHRSSVSIGIDLQQQMNVVGHNSVVINGYGGVVIGNIAYCLLNNKPIFGKSRTSNARPYIDYPFITIARKAWRTISSVVALGSTSCRAARISMGV